MIALVKYLKGYHVNKVGHLSVSLNKKDKEQMRESNLVSTEKLLRAVQWQNLSTRLPEVLNKKNTY